METATMDLPGAAVLAGRAASEPAAFAPLYDHYFPRVYNYIRNRQMEGEVTTGLLYLEDQEGEEPNDFHSIQGTVEEPLHDYPYENLCPGSAALNDLQARFR